MDQELAALAAAAAAMFVRKLASDGWRLAVSAMGALWCRVHPDRGDTVEAEAEETRDAAIAARASGEDDVEANLVREWQSRLRRLLTTEPGVADALRALVREWQPVDDDVHIGQMTTRVKASGRSRVTIAGRDVHIRSA